MRELLSNDREARLIYLKSNQLDFMLTSMSDEMSAFHEMSAPEEVTPFNRAHIKRSHFLSGLVGAGIAASITLVAWFSIQSSVISPIRTIPYESLANVVSEHEAVYEDAEASKHKNLDEGAVSLDRGIAELGFRNGARVVLREPADTGVSK